MAITAGDIYVRSGNQGAFTQVTYVQGGWITVASGSDMTSLDPTRLTDGQVVRVNVYPAANGVGCSSNQSITVRVNSILGSNSIGGDQTLCVGENPSVLSSVSTPTSSTGTLTFQWQSRSGINPFVNINGSTG